MGEWTETFRGMVKAWEVDAFEHFTVAYYYRCLGDATLNLFALCDLGPRHMFDERRALATIWSSARFRAELRAGDLLHIDSGVLDADSRGARVAHRLYNSGAGTLAAQFELRLRYMDLDSRRGAAFDPSLQSRLTPYIVAEEDARLSPPVTPQDDSSFESSAYDTVKPTELDVLGHMNVEYYVHRFSDASTQTLARFGMTPSYMRDHRVGFSTFEIQARFLRELKAGDRVRTVSTVVEAGNSSLRMLHRMYNVDSGEIACEMLQYGVHLDMDARRPSRFPSALRDAARALAVDTKPAP